MDRIRSLVAMARRRLLLEAWLASSLAAAPLAIGIVAVMVLERRLLGLSGAVAWWASGIGWLVASLAAALALAAVLGWLLVRARGGTDEQVAIELDGRIGSGERFATAISLEGAGAIADDPFARAAIADAVAYAARPEVAARARGAFPLRLPSRWWAVPSALVMVAAAWFLVPQLDRAAPAAAPTDAAAPRPKSAEERRLEEVIRQVESNEQLAAKLDAELAAAKRSLEEGADGPRRSPEESAREASRRIAEMQQRLSEVTEGTGAAASRELRDALAKLELPPAGSLAREFAESLKQGDFKSAKDALARIQEAAKADSGLTAADRERLAKDLEAAAKQLDALSKDPSKLAEALKNAGMDPALADNPAALRQAIQSSQQLNESQKQALQQMAQSSQGAQKKLSEMSKQCNSMSGQCRNPQQGQDPKQSQQGQQANSGQQGNQQSQQSDPSSQAGSQPGDSPMSTMLDEAETERQMQMAAESANSSCQGGGMSESEADSALRASSDDESDGSRPGQGEKDGAGGGRGQAEGGTRKMRETAFGTKFQKQKGQRQEGDVIAQQLVAGNAPTGESRVALEQVAAEIAPGYERGTDEDPVPAHLRDVHKRYFGDLRKKLEAKGIKPAAPARPAEAAPPPPPPAVPGGGAK